MTKEDALALPPTVRSFNGFYSAHGQFTMEIAIRILIAFAVLSKPAAPNLRLLKSPEQITRYPFIIDKGKVCRPRA